MTLDPEIVDGLLGSLDTVGRWIDSLERSEALPDDAEQVSSVGAEALRRWLAPAKAGAAVAAPAAQVRQNAPDWLAQWPEARRMQAFRAGGEHRWRRGVLTRRRIASFAATIRSPSPVIRRGCWRCERARASLWRRSKRSIPCKAGWCWKG